jgi:hypothetical protein
LTTSSHFFETLNIDLKKDKKKGAAVSPGSINPFIFGACYTGAPHSVLVRVTALFIFQTVNDLFLLAFSRQDL